MSKSNMHAEVGRLTRKVRLLQSRQSLLQQDLSLLQDYMMYDHYDKEVKDMYKKTVTEIKLIQRQQMETQSKLQSINQQMMKQVSSFN